MLDRIEFINAGNIPPLDRPGQTRITSTTCQLWEINLGLEQGPGLVSAWIRQTHLKELQILSSPLEEKKGSKGIRNNL